MTPQKDDWERVLRDLCEVVARTGWKFTAAEKKFWLRQLTNAAQEDAQ